MRPRSTTSLRCLSRICSSSPMSGFFYIFGGRGQPPKNWGKKYIVAGTPRSHTNNADKFQENLSISDFFFVLGGEVRGDSPWIHPWGLKTGNVTIIRPLSTTFIEMSMCYLLFFTHLSFFFLFFREGSDPPKKWGRKKYIVKGTPRTHTNNCVKFHENPPISVFFGGREQNPL